MTWIWVVVTVTAATVMAQDLDCIVSSGSTCFVINTDQKTTVTEAQRLCRDRYNGSLAVLNDRLKLKAARYLIDQTDVVQRERGYWIGLQRQPKSRSPRENWFWVRWSDDQTFMNKVADYTVSDADWEMGEPNNRAGIEHYGVLLGLTKVYRDVDALSRQGYICEYENADKAASNQAQMPMKLSACDSITAYATLQYVDRCLIFVTMRFGYKSARRNCVSFMPEVGTKLATIDGTDKLNAVADFLQRRRINSVWIGLYQNGTQENEPADGWMWEQGIPATFDGSSDALPWQSGEPNDFGAREDFALLNTGDRMFYDEQQGRELQSVCEFALTDSTTTTTTPSVVDSTASTASSDDAYADNSTATTSDVATTTTTVTTGSGGGSFNVSIDNGIVLGVDDAETTTTTTSSATTTTPDDSTTTTTTTSDDSITTTTNSLTAYDAVDALDDAAADIVSPSSSDSSTDTSMLPGSMPSSSPLLSDDLYEPSSTSSSFDTKSTAQPDDPSTPSMIVIVSDGEGKTLNRIDTAPTVTDLVDSSNTSTNGTVCLCASCTDGGESYADDNESIAESQDSYPSSRLNFDFNNAQPQLGDYQVPHGKGQGYPQSRGYQPVTQQQQYRGQPQPQQQQQYMDQPQQQQLQQQQQQQYRHQQQQKGTNQMVPGLNGTPRGDMTPQEKLQREADRFYAQSGTLKSLHIRL